MPQFTTQRNVPHSASQMFDLVADIEAYPQFLPLCEGLVVRERRDHDGKPLAIADMTVGYKSIRETFTSQVILDPPNATIHACYIDGPFSHLENIWRFAPASNGSTVHFHIDYEFRSRMLGLLMGSLFDKAFRKFTEAFERRAREVYGPPPADAAPDWLTRALRN